MYIAYIEVFFSICKQCNLFFILCCTLYMNHSPPLFTCRCCCFTRDHPCILSCSWSHEIACTTIAASHIGWWWWSAMFVASIIATSESTCTSHQQVTVVLFQMKEMTAIACWSIFGMYAIGMRSWMIAIVTYILERRITYTIMLTCSSFLWFVIVYLLLYRDRRDLRLDRGAFWIAAVYKVIKLSLPSLTDRPEVHTYPISFVAHALIVPAWNVVTIPETWYHHLLIWFCWILFW